MEPPVVVVVTGPPAAGKTTVAEDLARLLRIPIISKDTLKETLYEQFGSADELQEPIERAALALLFSVVETQLEARVSVVAESNFDANSDVHPFHRLAERYDVRIVQIHCTGATEAIVEKFVDRAVSGERHAGHQDEPADREEIRAKLEAGLWDALDLPGELIQINVIDTDPDMEALAERVRS
jgi:predicted kinase